MNERPRWLVFGVGNPGRGDDALGPLFIERLESWRDTAGDELAVEIVALWDFQLQIEHALDLKDVDVAVFVDASVSAGPPFEWRAVTPHFDMAHSTHALSPGAVLAVAARLGQTLPRAFTLGIAARDFKLGAPLTQSAERGLSAALHEFTLRAQAGRIEAPALSVGP